MRGDGDAPLAIACLFDVWAPKRTPGAAAAEAEQLFSFTVLTTSSNEQLSWCPRKSPPPP